MSAATRTLDQIGFWQVAASLGVVQFKLLVAQVLFGVALWEFVSLKSTRADALAKADASDFEGANTLLNHAFVLTPRPVRTPRATDGGDPMSDGLLQPKQ